MHTNTKSNILTLAALSTVLAVTVSGNYADKSSKDSLLQYGWLAQIGSQHMRRRPVDVSQYSFEQRIALRLQARLRRSGMRAAPSLNALTSAVEKRQKLLGKSIDVTFATEESDAHALWKVSAQKYPEWIAPSFKVTEATFTIDSDAVEKTFVTQQPLEVEPPSHAVLKEVQMHEDVANKAVVEGVAKSGYIPDAKLIAASIAKAFETDLEEIAIPLEKQEGRIINLAGQQYGEFSLWATGKSDYTGSTYGRSANVRKALSEHVNNTIVAPGEEFSFNSTLNGPVSQGNGWHMAKIIVNGGDLEYAPGGGICQASTTVYRAVVNAGFPVVDRRAHSLYVSYYKKHGVGIDATIFPGSQDLSFVNDSNNYLLIQSYNDGTEAYVHIYGTPDNREVALEGPYFSSTAPAGFLHKGRPIAKNEVVWVQHVTYPDGSQKSTHIASRYRSMPQSLANEFQPELNVHASAPLASVTD